MNRRLSVMVLSVTMVAVVAFGIPLGLAVRRLYLNEATLRLQRAAASSAIQVPRSFESSGDPVELPRRFEGIGLTLYGPDGRRLSGPGPAHPDSVVAKAIRGVAGTGAATGNLVAAVPLTSNERVYGIVEAALPRSSVNGRVARAWVAMGLTALAALALAALVAWRQTRRLVRPVRELADAADRLGAGDFSVRPTATGISELDTVAETLCRTAERLGRMIGRERTFSEDASHQLRSPLTALRLRFEMAQTTPDLSSSDLVEGSLADVDRLEATVDALLRLAREVQPARTTLDVGALLDHVASSWHGRLAAAGRRLRLRGANASAGVRASTPAMHQVLDVLVSNAAEHGAGTVTVDVHDISGGLAIDVIDEGPGVVGPTEAVFERRSEVNGPRGIGLALARSLTEAEGGRLLLRRAGPRPVFRVLLVSDREVVISSPATGSSPAQGDPDSPRVDVPAAATSPAPDP